MNSTAITKIEIEEREDEFIDIETPTENFILESGIISHNSRNAMKGQQKEIVQLLTIMRQRNLIVVICIPSINIVESYIKEHRIRSLTMVKARGRVHGYGQNKVARIIGIMKSKRGKVNTSLIPPGFKINVPDAKIVFPEFWVAYRKKKDAMIIGKNVEMQELLEGVKNKEEVTGDMTMYNKKISYIEDKYSISRSSIMKLWKKYPKIIKKDVLGRYQVCEKEFKDMYYDHPDNE